MGCFRSNYPPMGLVILHHKLTSSWAVPRLTVTTITALLNVPVVLILKYRSTAPLAVILSVVAAPAAVKAATFANVSVQPLSDDPWIATVAVPLAILTTCR